MSAGAITPADRAGAVVHYRTVAELAARMREQLGMGQRDSIRAALLAVTVLGGQR